MSSEPVKEEPVRVLVAAPYATVRAGLRALVGADARIVVVGEAAGPGALSAALEAVEPGVVLLDDDLRGWDGALAGLAETGTPLVAIGEDPADAARLAESALPAWAYLIRGAGGDEMSAAVLAVRWGFIVLDGSLRRMVAGPPALSDPASIDDAADTEPLTDRELQVLRLVASGLPNKQIASRLGVSPNTVKFHVAAILAKLGAGSRAEAVSIGLRSGRIAF